MNKTYIPLPADKVLHVLVGFALALLGSVLQLCFAPFVGLEPLGGGVLFVALAAALKEWWDKRGHGTPDELDFYATLGGGCAGLFFFIVAEVLVRIAQSMVS